MVVGVQQAFSLLHLFSWTLCWGLEFWSKVGDTKKPRVEAEDGGSYMVQVHQKRCEWGLRQRKMWQRGPRMLRLEREGQIPPSPAHRIGDAPHIPLLPIALCLNLMLVEQPSSPDSGCSWVPAPSHFSPVTQSFCSDQTVQGGGEGRRGRQTDIQAPPSSTGEHRGRQQDFRKRQLSSLHVNRWFPREVSMLPEFPGAAAALEQPPLPPLHHSHSSSPQGCAKQERNEYQRKMQLDRLGTGNNGWQVALSLPLGS